jgi:manganese-transporting P-type ATPase
MRSIAAATKTASKEEETQPLVSSQSVDPSGSSSSSRTKADHYHSSSVTKVTPLIERHVWMRGDVAPFCVFYLLLIALDHMSLSAPSPSSDDMVLLHTLLRTIQMLAFPLVLLSHLVVVLLQQWRVSFQCRVGYRTAGSDPARAGLSSFQEWTHCLVETPALGNKIDMGIVPVQHRPNGVTVSFRDVVFRYSQGADTEMDGLWRTNVPQDKAMFHRLRYPIDLPLEFYMKEWRGHATLESVQRSHRVYGSNTTSIQLPAFLDLLGQQLLAPFFLFQLFCVVLWSLDEYWYYAIFTLFALVMFECTVAFNRLKSLERLRGTLRHPYHVSVHRHGLWMLLKTDELVPGDLVSLTTSHHKQHAHVPADLLILNGSAVVDEALLTGESIPQRKGPLDETCTHETLTQLNVQDQLHKQSILFGGTMLVSHVGGETRTMPPPPDNGILCVVLKTGFETAQGSLLRTMTHSSLKSADGIHTQDTFVFVAILLCCAIVSAISVLQDGWHDETRNRFRLVLHVIIIVTSVVPPELPMELSLAVTNSVADLMRHCHVYCTEPYRIPWAGRVDVCCFDKTGTLTSDEMQLKGVRILTNGVDDDPLIHPSDTDLPWDVLRVMVACQSLSVSELRRDVIFGDPMERAVLEESGYTLRGNNLVVAKEAVAGKPRGIFIHHRFAFSSRLKRMTVLVTEDNATEVYGVTKGAPETVKTFLSSVPDKYDEVYQHHMRLGRRVLAMASRNFGNANVAALKERGRVAVEKDLTFCGFLVLDCPLKADSKYIISELKKSDHETVMITGDAVLTGAEVARQVGIIDKDCGPTYELQCRESDEVNGSALSEFHFVALNSTTNLDVIPLSTSNLALLRDMKDKLEASFCVSGSVMAMLGLSALKHASVDVDPIEFSRDDNNLLLHPAVQEVLKDLVQIISVYARHAPRQKEAIVAAYNLAGKHTMMTGDGTNDVGALKRAHVGISIISAPELEAKQREATAAIAKEQRKEKKARKEGKAKKKNGRLEESLRQLQATQNELDQVELGDASMASPFTSRAMSVKCCKDVLQQGRCTLVTMLTIYKILGVNCLVNALVLTKLHIHGVKQGDRQLTIIGIAVAALFLFVTRGKPLPTLSPKRPPSSVLCTQALLSIAAQFAVHFTFIMIATDTALAFVDPYDPSIIPDASFNPNVLNSCTFLLTMVATVNTFIVNYRGSPFMQNLKDNKLLLRSAQVCYAVIFACSLEVFPPLNDLFQIAAFPDTQAMDAGGAVDDDWTLSISEAGGLTSFVRYAGFPVAMSLFMVADIVMAFAVERMTLMMFP